MAQQEAKRFIEVLQADSKLMEELQAKAQKAEQTASDAYVSMAKELGYEFTAEELAAELQAQQVNSAIDADAAEVDDVEMEQVVGGGVYDHVGPDRCHDTYKDGESCTFTDKCTRLVNCYRYKDACSSTYLPSQTCAAVDRCDAVFVGY